MAAAAPTPPRERLIAEGSSARLFASRDAAGRPAALKLSRNAGCDATLLAEADAAARFTHPALLPILQHGRDEEGRVWLLLPLLSGRTLADWRPDTSALLAALGPIADALDYLHHGGAGHADLKPANILLSEAEGRTELLLGDLGLVSSLGEIAAGGTPAYLSPARLDGRPFTWEDDLHAFAVLTFENLAGCLPWSAVAGEALLKDIRKGRMRGLRTQRPELPGELDGFFACTLRGERRDSSAMGWLDALRAQLGMNALPRGPFLRPSSDPTGDIATRERLTAWLHAHLYSSTTAHVIAGYEELRSLEELARGDEKRLRRVLKILVKEHWLQDHAGQAIFAGEPGSVLVGLRERLSVDAAHPDPGRVGWAEVLAAFPPAFTLEELAASLGLDPIEEMGLQTAVERKDVLPSGLFASLWKRSKTRPSARLLLIGLAQAMGAENLHGEVPQSSVLELIEKAPAELCDSLRSYLRNHPHGPQGARLLGLLDVVRLVRSDALDSAIEHYWAIDAELDAEVNATLNRLLVYQLTDSGRVHEAQGFLNRWRERHGVEVAGTPIEIQIAAREINILSTYGAHAEATTLARTYLQRFAGRPGAWVLHMAMANLAYDHGDGREKLAHAEAALEALQKEQGPENMELDLITFVAGGIVQAGDRSRWGMLPALLHRADELAGAHEILSITHRVEAIRAQQLMYRGDLRDADQQLQKIRRSAERSGELRRAQFIEGSLFFVARELGEYQRLLVELARFDDLIGATEGIQAILSLREELILLQVALGELSEAEAVTEVALGLAEEASCILLVGLFRGLRGRIRDLQEQHDPAISDFKKAVAALTAAHAFRHRNEYQLELIAADPEADPEGALVAAVIDHEEAVGERRLLPRAWQLEARRLRRAGAIHDAALALEEAFRVAGTLVSPEHRWPLHVEAAELALAAGERNAARAELERAVAILHDLSLQFTDAAVRERFLARPDRRAVLARLRALDA